jgi:hypothetical protein
LALKHEDEDDPGWSDPPGCDVEGFGETVAHVEASC